MVYQQVLLSKHCDRLYISSYSKTDIRALAAHCVQDMHKLNLYIHKILMLRVHTLQYACTYNLLFLDRSSSVLSIDSNTSNLDVVWYSHLCNLLQYNNSKLGLSTVNIFFDCFSIVSKHSCLYSNYGYYLYYYGLCIAHALHSILGNRGVASLPTRIQKYTVLRSPHTDKKSREQFERRTHKKVYSFPSLFAEYYVYLCDKHYAYLSCTLVHEPTRLCNE